jgi:hypothetical protein
MKKFVFAIVAVFGFAAAAQAADVSNDLLSKMGLGGMQRLSDAQGMDIRGMGDQIIDVYSLTNISKIDAKNWGGNQQIIVVQGSNVAGDIENNIISKGHKGRKGHKRSKKGGH